jgi:circadian clock protein KaiC
MAENDETHERLKTYVGGLDERLGGGIPRGHIVLLCGGSGTLKSSFAFNILYNLAKERKIKGSYLSLEQSRASLKRHMKKLGMDPDEVKDALAIIDLGALRKEMREFEKTEKVEWLESLERQIRTYKSYLGFEVLVIDSLDALYVLSRLDNPRNEMFHFFEVLRDLELTTIMISEMPQDRVQFGKYEVEPFLADGIIHLVMEREGRTVGRYVSVVKMRETKHSTDYFPLLVDQTGFKIVTK